MDTTITNTKSSPINENIDAASSSSICENSEQKTNEDQEAMNSKNEASMANNKSMVVDCKSTEFVSRLDDPETKILMEDSETYSDDLVQKWDEDDSDNTDPNKILDDENFGDVADNVDATSLQDSETEKPEIDNYEFAVKTASTLEGDSLEKQKAENLEELNADQNNRDIEMCLDDVIASIDKGIAETKEDREHDNEKGVKKLEMPAEDTSMETAAVIDNNKTKEPSVTVAEETVSITDIVKTTTDDIKTCEKNENDSSSKYEIPQMKSNTKEGTGENIDSFAKKLLTRSIEDSNDDSVMKSTVDETILKESHSPSDPIKQNLKDIGLIEDKSENIKELAESMDVSGDDVQTSVDKNNIMETSNDEKTDQNISKSEGIIGLTANTDISKENPADNTIDHKKKEDTLKMVDSSVKSPKESLRINEDTFIETSLETFKADKSPTEEITSIDSNSGEIATDKSTELIENSTISLTITHKDTELTENQSKTDIFTASTEVSSNANQIITSTESISEIQSSIEKHSAKVDDTSQNVPLTLEVPIIKEAISLSDLPSTSKGLPSENISSSDFPSESLMTSSSLPSETPSTSTGLPSESLMTSTGLPSQNQEDQMAPDASDEIPEVVDSLGLLAESCRSMDDQDNEDDEPEPDEDDVDDDDDFDNDDESNPTPMEHSEDSNNAQSSETEQPKEIEGLAERLIEATDGATELIDKAIVEPTIEKVESVTDTPIGEIKIAEIENVREVESKTPIDEDINQKIECPAGSSKLEMLLKSERGDKTPTKSITDSPSKIKKLEIVERNVTMNFVDLGETSSEDDVQEVNNATELEKKTEVSEKEVTINLPKEIEVMSNSTTSTSNIVTKEGEVEIKGIPKPTVAKVARLNTDEISIKTANLNARIVIPEAKVDNDTVPNAVTELNQEVFNLDSDEDKPKEEKSPKSREPKIKGRCVNPLCDSEHETSQRIQADPAILRFYEVKKKKKEAVVCVQCANKVALRMQDLLQGVKSLQPLLDLELTKSVQELVEISDSETDSDTEETEKDLIGNKAAKFLEDELESMINNTWKKYNLDERLQLAKEQLNQDVEKLEKEAKEIDVMLDECQKATDQVRKDFYSVFARRISNETPFVIVDTPHMKYSYVKSDPAPVTRAASKRNRSSSSDGTFAKKGAITVEHNKEEVNEQATYADSKDDDNTEVKVVKLSVESAPSNLPPVGELTRPPVKVGDYVMAARHANWTKGRVEFVSSKPMQGMHSVCRIKFEHKGKAQSKTLSCRNVAYGEPANVRLTIGTRIIALFKDPTNTQKRDAFYSGVVAEAPNPMNTYRYLVFFDDGYAQYVTHENTRVVVERSNLVWDDVHPMSRDFVRDYLLAYPERPMVRLHAGQKLKTEWNGKWWISKVLQVDASLVNVHFEADDRTEWIYRGSTRLAPLYLELQAAERHRSRALPRSTGNNKARGVNVPYVEYTRSEDNKEDAEAGRKEQEEMRRQRAVAKKSTAPPIPNLAAPNDTAVMSRVVYYTPKAAVKPYKMSPHNCSAKCKRTDVLPLKELRTYNPLARPLLSGWERQIVRFRFRREIMYRAPCGRRLRNMEELHRYLMITDSEMSVDLFDFCISTHCLAEFVLNRCLVSKKDLSHGKENVPVPCVNYYDTSLPEFCSYNTERTPTAGVPLNLDPEFLCGCDCTDDCRDKSKCACWRLTLEGARTIGMDDDVGYVYKRLNEPVPSGIYECNSRCKCKQTCLNRVAQHPLQLKLQVFKTQNRGWGIRALNDVPKGAFLCVYAGNLLTDATANLDGLNEGDEYLAELDYIEVVEQMKEGYEADIPEKDKELDRRNSNKDSTSSSSEEEEEENPSRADEEDGDFKPDFEPGVALFSKRLRKREKKAQEEQKQKEKKEDDCITISDDEELREPSRFTAQAGMGNSEFISKYKSTRELFGNDEACYIMDAKVQGNIGRYLNHSCTPNVFVQNVFVDTHDPRFPWVAFFALTHVKAGTELTWNYNYDIGSVPGKVLYCYCGATNCRGRLL